MQFIQQSGSIFSANQQICNFFVANGKDNVLGLRNLITISKEVRRGGGVVFMIDRDFDGLKSYPDGKDIYVTPTYAVENMLICREAFRHILLADFKMSDPDCIDDVELALGAFDKLLAQHQDALEEANRLIHHVRMESLSGIKLTSGSITDQCHKFADLNARTLEIVKIASGDGLSELIRLVAPVSQKEIYKHSNSFNELDPALNWRGKFLFYLFRRLLGFLIEDRNGKKPSFFSKGSAHISIAVNSDSLIRTLAAVCIIPPCLCGFVLEISSRKLV